MCRSRRNESNATWMGQNGAKTQKIWNKQDFLYWNNRLNLVSNFKITVVWTYRLWNYEPNTIWTGQIGVKTEKLWPKEN